MRRPVGQVLRTLDGAAAADAVPVLFRASFLDPATVAAARPDRRARRLPLLPAPAAPARRWSARSN
ncbi:hypothetical protein [Kitasatospora cineracea]|uniref:hypothetical protein n=1 Tax=Kitasatospora cineracea TaxID=88074 RepID=UPI00379BCD1F